MLRDYLAAARCCYWSSSGSASSEIFNWAYRDSASSIHTSSKYEAIVSWLRQTKGSWGLAVRSGSLRIHQPWGSTQRVMAGQAGSGSASAPRERTLHLAELHLLPAPSTPMADAQPVTPDEPCATLPAQVMSPFFSYFSCRVLHLPLLFLLLTSSATNSPVSKTSHLSL